jgi:hypothetical protein
MSNLTEKLKWLVENQQIEPELVCNIMHRIFGLRIGLQSSILLRHYYYQIKLVANCFPSHLGILV